MTVRQKWRFNGDEWVPSWVARLSSWLCTATGDLCSHFRALGGLFWPYTPQSHPLALAPIPLARPLPQVCSASSRPSVLRPDVRRLRAPPTSFGVLKASFFPRSAWPLSPLHRPSYRFILLLFCLTSLPFPFRSVLFCFILFLGLIGSWALQPPPRCSRNVYKRRKRFRDAKGEKGPG